MKIILTQDVPNLGSLGDEVQVKNGYARNFLLPKGMAMPAGGKNAKAIQHRRLFLEKVRTDAIAAAQGEAEKVKALQLTIMARAGTGGRLFGSVTNRDLQALIAEQGYELDRKSIALHTPVKSLGTFGATVKLHSDVKVELEFKVEASETVAAPGEGTEEGAVEGVEEGAEGAGEATAPEAAPEDTEATAEGATGGAEEGAEGTEKATAEAATEGGDTAAEAATDSAEGGESAAANADPSPAAGAEETPPEAAVSGETDTPNS